MSLSKSHRWALAGILLVALVLRVWGIGFGLPDGSARPDETSVAGPAVTFLSGNLEPPFFVYPTGFMYALSGVYVVYYQVTKPWASYKTLHEFSESRRQNLAPFLLASRGISVVMGVLTVAWLFLLGARTTDRRIGLVAAAFLALSFLHVRDSHFGVTDTTMTAFVVWAVYQIVKWHESGSPARALIAGLIGGLAMSTKYNGLGVAVPFGVAAFDRLITSRRGRKPIAPILISSAAFAIAFGAVFSASTFYMFIQPERFMADVVKQSADVAGGYGLGFPVAWVQHATTTLPASVGWPMFLAGVAGIIAFFVRDVRRALIVFAFPIAYYVVAGNGYSAFARYMLPVIPFICFGAAYGSVHFVELMAAQTAAARRRALISLAVLLVLPTAVKSIQIGHLLSRTDNRVVVANTIGTIVPSGATILQTGSSYGRVRLPGALRLQEVTEMTALPDFILVQRSPLVLYSVIPTGMPDLLQSSYTLIKAFPAGDDRPRPYDQQDAFFLPLGNFDGIERPGPSFELYQRKGML